PDDLCVQRGCETLEQAFIDYLEADQEADHLPHHTIEEDPLDQPAITSHVEPPPQSAVSLWFSRMWAYAQREAMELRHDAIRLAFAIIGPIIVLCAATWGLSFDVKDVRFAVLDRDQTTDSRRFIEHFAGSTHFVEQAPLSDASEIDTHLRSSKSWLVIDVPPGFGSDLIGARQPEVAFYVDGGSLVRAAHTVNSIKAVAIEHAFNLARATPGADMPTMPISIEPRMAYNPSYQSVFVFGPSNLMLAMTLIPAMLTALGVVREKEMGTMVNLYASPGSISEFLIGKQLPYVALTMLSYFTLVGVLIWGLGVPLKGSFLALTLGATAYAFAITAMGLLISAFVQTQVAAQFLTAILCVIITTNFAGVLSPVSTLDGINFYIAQGFPASWFQKVTLGVFTKNWQLQWNTLGLASVIMMGFSVVYLTAARLFVSKQER
nr:ABC transporter permease [Aquabacterium sp.]